MRVAGLVDNFRSLLDLAAPPTCLYCGTGAVDGPVCGGCHDDLPWNDDACPGCALPSPLGLLCRFCRRKPRRFDSAWTAFVLEAPVHPSLLGLKYHARFEQGRALGGLMASALNNRTDPLPDLLLPVPLHWRRLVRRGYNQSLLITRELARQLAVPCDAQALKRTRAGRDQIGQTRTQRRQNLRGAFACGRRLDGLHVALVDDVMTTGSTLDELARVCRRAGAVRIEAWAAARTP